MKYLRLPKTVNEKPVCIVSLNRLCGGYCMNAAITTNEIPAYLNEPKEVGYIYGTLEYDERKNLWIVRGEPPVLQMAKRLFPGSASYAGYVKFPANKRSTGDLNWLMQRFPLKILSHEKWEQLRKEAIDHVLRRQEILKKPQYVKPPPTFVGELKNYQKEGVAWLLHNERTLLADETGLGKTPQALAWLATLNAFPALYVTQPHLLLQANREIKKFLRLEPIQNSANQWVLFQDDMPDGSVTTHIIHGLTPYELPRAHIYLIHYLLLRGWKNILAKFGFKAVVFDEIHELRRSKNEKYSAASLISDSVPYVCGLSGTPIYNYGGEIWNVMNIVEYHSLGDWDSFTREWAYGYGNKIIRDPELLGDYLRREGLLLRRTKKDVAHELPPKRRYVQFIESDEGVFKEIIKEAVELAVRSSKASTPFEKGRLEGEAIRLTRRATGVAKARYVAAFVRTLLEVGEPVVLFAYHHDVWDIYREALKDYNPVFITGRETTKEKNDAQNAFVTGQTDLICISLRAATGLNLQREDAVVVFGELDWSPAVHTQAEDRVHRIGQETSVLCYYLVSEHGMDQEMMEAIGLKVQQFTELMGDTPETEEDRFLSEVEVSKHMRKVIEKLQRMNSKLQSEAE